MRIHENYIVRKCQHMRAKKKENFFIVLSFRELNWSGEKTAKRAALS